MIELVQLPEETRCTLISQVKTKTGISVKAIEKDWWVTLVYKMASIFGGHSNVVTRIGCG